MIDAPARAANGRGETKLSDEHLLSERSLVASAIINPTTIDVVQHQVSGLQFRDTALGDVFDFLVSLRGRGFAFDDITVLACELRDAGLLDRIGGKLGLREVLKATPHADHAGYHARKIADQYRVFEFKRLGGELTQLAMRPDADPAKLATWLNEQKQDLEAPSAEELSYRLLSAAELADGDYKASYLVEGVLSEGQPCILGGPQKTLKTSIAIDLQLSIATGDPFLGRFAVNGTHRTLLMSGESGMRTLQETANRVARAKGRQLRDVPDAMFSDQIPQLYSDEHLKALERMLDGNGIRCLLVDPAYLCVDGSDAGNLFAIGKQLRPVAEICQNREVTLILLHHTKKGSENVRGGEPLELADIAWSGFGEFARQWLLLGRRKRYEEGTGRHELWLTFGGSMGHSGLVGIDVEELADGEHAGRTWQLEVLNPTEARQEARQSAAELQEAEREARKQATLQRNADKVRAAFRANGGKGMTKSSIRDRAGVNANVAGEAIGYLLRIGELEECTVTTRTGDYEGFRCVPK